MTEEKKEIKKEEYTLVEVPTGSALAIQRPDETIMTTEFALVEILNKLDKIERQVA
jgi:hypothetical protein